MSGKGDTPRPISVPAEEFARRFERIFGVPLRKPGRRPGGCVTNLHSVTWPDAVPTDAEGEE